MKKRAYVQNSTVQTHFNGVNPIDNTLYCFKNGYVDEQYTSLVFVDYAWYYFKNGVVNYTETTMTQVNGEGVYYYVVNSKIAWQTTALIYYDNE